MVVCGLPCWNDASIQGATQIWAWLGRLGGNVTRSRIKSGMTVGARRGKEMKNLGSGSGSGRLVE